MENLINKLMPSPQENFKEPQKQMCVDKLNEDDFSTCVFNKATKSNNHTIHCVEKTQRNRKTFAFWTAITILVVLTIANLILTISIMSVLRLGKGINGMEFIPSDEIVKFSGTTELERLYTKSKLRVDSLKNEPILIVGSDGLNVRIFRNGYFANRITMDNLGTQIRFINGFELKDPLSKNSIFSTHRPSFNIPAGCENLTVKSVSTSKIVSPIDGSLNIKSSSKISTKGSEGIHLESFGVFLKGDNILVNSTQNFVAKSSNIFLDMNEIPIASAELGLRSLGPTYKLCICMPQGMLFRIPLPRIYNSQKFSCSQFDIRNDPCKHN